jgi:hypothetical protein
MVEFPYSGVAIRPVWIQDFLFFGDRVKIEYIKDSIRRNAVTRISVLKKN